ncbi:MAG: alpha/beta hydrolase [Candidatus Sumerlaeota bacterium]|nr:alpha/beta hydrolase [Candidatus Sumerlaeota bacterium]
MKRTWSRLHWMPFLLALVLWSEATLNSFAQEGLVMPSSDSPENAAQAPASRPKNAGNAPAKAQKTPRGPEEYTRQPNLRDVAYGPHERNDLDLWKAKSDRPTPLAVFFHPGAFMVGDKTWIPKPFLETCLEKGISVATANYRFSKQAPFPAQLEDGARAIQFLRLHAAEWNLDPKAVAA